MNRQDKITVLAQVGPIAEVNLALLRLASRIPMEDGKKLSDIVKKLLEACDLLNQMGAEMLETETADPINN